MRRLLILGCSQLKAWLAASAIKQIANNNQQRGAEQ